ncbi:hypothetical protein MHU86_4972 [Fragilaria crotonensis]|nr:hypothetical protein MHU86_4972 [Fragilaria crotonensis]
MVAPDAGTTAAEAKNAKLLASPDPSSVAATLLSIRRTTTSTLGEEDANCRGMPRKTKEKTKSRLRPASRKLLTPTSNGHLECRDHVVMPQERQESSAASFEAKQEMNQTSSTRNGRFADAADFNCVPKEDKKGGDSFADGCLLSNGLSSGQGDSPSMSARTKQLRRLEAFPCLGQSNTDAIHCKNSTTDSQVGEGASSFVIPRKRKCVDSLPRGETMPSPGPSNTKTNDSTHSKTEGHAGEGASSFTIPRKRKLVEDTPGALGVSGVINSGIVESRSPRKTKPLPPVAGQTGERLVSQTSLIAASLRGSGQ